MVRLNFLLVVCVLLAVAQTGFGWYWRKQDCPQQEHCPLTCGSGYVIDSDNRGCKIQLCRCNDVCEYFNCPENTRCQRKLHCKTWRGCSVYATCTLTRVLSPNQSPEEDIKPQTQKLTATTVAKTSKPPTNTTTAAPTTVPTTAKTVRTTSGGEAITRKTVSPNLCPDNQQPLQGWNCDVTLLRGRPCPSNFRCETDLSGGVALCCPVALGQAPKPTETFVVVTETTQSFCSDGRPELPGVNCGRGGERCPSSHTCVIDPADRFAVCCPIPVPDDQPMPTTESPSRTYCSDGEPHIAGWHCGRGGERCPDTHKCLIDPADRFAVCCPIPVPVEPITPVAQLSLPMCEQPVKAGFCKSNLPRWYFNSATGLCVFFRYGGCNGNANNFSSKQACERSCGRPNESYCSLPAEVGRCRAAFRRYYYDQTTRECTQFIYGGCEGNGNNFATIEQCEQFC